jgi:hypothetical protein
MPHMCMIIDHSWLHHIHCDTHVKVKVKVKKKRNESQINERLFDDARQRSSLGLGVWDATFVFHSVLKGCSIVRSNWALLV